METVDKQRKAEAYYVAMASFMNESMPESLLTICWTELNVPDAVGATMEWVDKYGFSLKIACQTLFGHQYEITKKYIFTPPLHNYEESRERLTSLHSTSSQTSVWPGVSGWISLLLYLQLLFCLVDFEGLLDGTGLDLLQKFCLKIFVSQSIAALIMLLVVVIHTCEGLYVMYILRKAGIPLAIAYLWSSFTVLLGFPVTMRARTLAKVAATKKKAE